jgi:hypothetical protein
MVANLNEIAQSASDAPLIPAHDLGQLSLRLAESFRALAEDTQLAQNLMNSPEMGQRIKAGVQNLGTVCIELVKLNGQRRNFPNDQVLAFFLLTLVD